MSPGVFIAGDWGTSSLRLYRCEYGAEGPAKILEIRTGPGVERVETGFEETFFELAAGWLSGTEAPPVILSGMVGSTLGWQEAPYQSCPLSLDAIATCVRRFQARGTEFSIIAGVRCQNPLGEPDLMRGEELQLLGWAESGAAGPEAGGLVALPGTHNKWVSLQSGRIETFLTAMSGELYALLLKHSVLIADRSQETFHADSFRAGVERSRQPGGLQLLHTLFATRARQITGSLSSGDADSYLSGLITGADVVGALALFCGNHSRPAVVSLIGEAGLCRRYRVALQHLCGEVRECDPDSVALAGFAAVYKALYRGGKE